MSSKCSVDVLAQAGLPVNCRIYRGQLLPALSPAACRGEVPQGIIFAGYSVGTGRYFLCTNSEVYVSGNGEDFIRLSSLACETPFLIEDIDGEIHRAAVIGKTSAVAHNSTSFKTFIYGASLSCGVMHCGRLFGADSSDGHKLCWSGEGGVSDWKQGIYGSGSLQLDPARGIILDIAEYGGKLVAIRKFGLTVLDMFGLTENFSVGQTDTDTDEIYAGTAKVAGDKLLFYTASGLCSFDGSKVSHISHRCADDISAPQCSAVRGSKYYLGCFSKSLGRKAVLCYDVEDGESYIIDGQADAICAGEKLYIYNSSGTYSLEEGGKYSFTVSGLGFGFSGSKTVTRIDLDCGGGADVEISNGRLTRKFSAACEIIRPKLRGKSFTVKISGSSPINSLNATAEVCNGI